MAEHAEAVGWAAFVPAATTQVRVTHQPPYVFTDDEVRRLFAAIDSQPMSSHSNKALVDPVLFRVLYGTGLRVSEALKLTLADVDTQPGTLRIRDSKNGHNRTIPITNRLAATLDAHLVAAHPAPEPSDRVFYTKAPGKPMDQSESLWDWWGLLSLLQLGDPLRILRSDRSTGTTPAGSTATSAPYPPWSSKRRTTLPNRPTPTGSESKTAKPL